MCYLDLYETLSIFVPTITSFIILIFTLWVQKRHFNIEMEEQKEQFKTSLKENKAYYDQQLLVDSENIRIANRPFLWLDRNIQLTKKAAVDMVLVSEHMDVGLTICNIGNGLAEGIEVIMADDPEEGKQNFISKPIDLPEGRLECIYNDYLFINVLPVGKESHFGFSCFLYPKDNGQETWFESNGWINIRLKFYDAFENEYEQQFRFLLSGKGEVFRIETMRPELRGKSEC